MKRSLAVKCLLHVRHAVTCYKAEERAIHPCRSGFCTVQIRRTSKYIHASSETRIPLRFNILFVLPPSFRIPQVPNRAESLENGRV
jgi:hypothetical protein